MSYQPRIDQYYKSTSSNKRIDNSVKFDDNRLKRTKLVNNHRPNNGKRSSEKSTPLTSIGKGQSSFCSNSVIKSYQNDNNNQKTDKSLETQNRSLSLANDVPKKRVITEFASACNAPRTKSATEKISLKKQRKTTLISSRVVKKSLVKYDENIATEWDTTEVVGTSSICRKERSAFHQRVSVNYASDNLGSTERKIENVDVGPSGITTCQTPIEQKTVNLSLVQRNATKTTFSPKKATLLKKVRFNTTNITLDLSKSDILSSMNETENSEHGFLRSTNLRNNSGFNDIQVSHEIKNSSIKVNESANFSTNFSNTTISSVMKEMSKSPTRSRFAVSPLKNSEIMKTPTKRNSPLDCMNKNGSPRTPSNSNTSPSGEQLFTSPTKRRKLSFSPKIQRSPKKVFKERVDTDLATLAVENLNKAKQGIIPLNEFDLENIYEKQSFDFEYGSLNAKATIKYEAKDVNVPEDKHGDHFFMVIVNVFSEPMNCGYFNDGELDRIFSILTLSREAQSLLTRMLKRKRGWHRIDAIKYPEIGADLKAIFQELVVTGILVDDIANDEIQKMLNLLQVDEVRTVCQQMKVNPKGAKPILIRELIKLANRKNSLFPGMKSPSSALTEKITGILGTCVRLPDSIENLLRRIFVLLIPNQDPKENMAEAFRMLALVHYGDIIFPVTSMERFPIFRNREHLIRYSEGKAAWTRIFNASEAKDWDTVCTLGHLASDHLQPYFEKNDNSQHVKSPKLPSHVKQFDENYPWTKVLWKSIEGFKKTKEGIEIAAKFLRSLLNQRKKISGNSIRLYNELALIEMHHRKNLEASADLTIEALMEDKLSDIDIAVMSDRARKLLGRSKNIDAKTKERLVIAIQPYQEMLTSIAKPDENVIEATIVQGNTTGSKSTWSVNMGGNDVGYVKVEQVALLHYSEKGFRYGLHCEGSLPVTLFATLFWDEIYEIPVPGAFISPYQDAPLDLYTSRFLDNRRERIENKLTLVKSLNVDLLGEMMRDVFIKYRCYTCLIHSKLFEDPDEFKAFVECLGTIGVVGICERLANNYNQWKSGFPDLAVWDTVNKKCKFVEVKGPGDTLSTKQKLWIQFLKELGVDVEVCIVKGTTRKYAV